MNQPWYYMWRFYPSAMTPKTRVPPNTVVNIMHTRSRRYSFTNINRCNLVSGPRPDLLWFRLYLFPDTRIFFHLSKCEYQQKSNLLKLQLYRKQVIMGWFILDVFGWINTPTVQTRQKAIITTGDLLAKHSFERLQLSENGHKMANFTISSKRSLCYLCFSNNHCQNSAHYSHLESFSC